MSFTMSLHCLSQDLIYNKDNSPSLSFNTLLSDFFLMHLNLVQVNKKKQNQIEAKSTVKKHIKRYSTLINSEIILANICQIE